MAKLRVGVVGVGHLGRHHARVYSQLPQVELVGVNDIVPEKAGAVASEYQTKEFCSQPELLQEVQAVSIATSTSGHYEVAKQALERGVQVLIEKPLCSSYQQAEELVNLAHKKNLILDRKSTRLNSSHIQKSRMPSSA